VQVGSDGRYRVEGIPDGTFVKITGGDTVNVYTAGVPQGRFCGTNTFMRGDTELDVSLFLPGAAVPTPTLSGQIFTVVDGVRKPLVGADVYYNSRAFGPDVSGYTNAAGQYNLCGIPPMPGTLSMFCGNDILIYQQAIDIRENHVLDIDATEFYSCLALPPVP